MSDRIDRASKLGAVQFSSKSSMISFLDNVVYILIYARGLSTNLSLLGGGGFDPRISSRRRCGLERVSF